MSLEQYGQPSIRWESRTDVFVPSPADYWQARTAAMILGADGTQIPSYSEVEESLTPDIRRFLTEEQDRGDTPELVFHVPVSEELPLTRMTQNYETAVRESNPGVYSVCSISSSVWQIEDASALNQGVEKLGAGFEVRGSAGPAESITLPELLVSSLKRQAFDQNDLIVTPFIDQPGVECQYLESYWDGSGEHPVEKSRIKHPVVIEKGTIMSLSAIPDEALLSSMNVRRVVRLCIS